MNLKELLNNCLVFDIETSAHYPDGREINIRTNFEDYIQYAKCKWFGCYSYKYNKEYYLEVSKDYDLIKTLLKEHGTLIGFNSEEFDYPILINNFLVDKETWYLHVDCMKILGSSTFKDKNGFKYKGRGELMDYKFKNNKLSTVAETMKLDFQKGDIDYKIFHKNEWTPFEIEEIINYLKNDTMATKQMFDKLWEYWESFTELLDYKNIKNLSWIRNSIASLVYKCICHHINVEPTYTEGKSSEEMGGFVLTPQKEECEDVFYIDFSQMYPHVMSMFNLFSETTEINGRGVWHENELFKAKGYYDISKQHKISELLASTLKKRNYLKENDPNNPMSHTLKIFNNSAYGLARSPIFEKVHTPNMGWDTCWISQQINAFAKKEMERYGFEVIYQDTDSAFVHAIDKKHNNPEYVKSCINKIVKKIRENVPFPAETFKMDIESFLPYVLFPYSFQPVVDETTGKNLKKGNRLIKQRVGRKKNYLYIYEKNGKKDVKLVGLPIKKDESTPLGIKIYNEVLKPKILLENTAKFPKKFIDAIIANYLNNKEILNLLAREFKIKPYSSYKIPKGKTEPSSIHAQISKGYFNGGDGVISLIKNNKIGKAGKGMKYCTVAESIEAKLSIEDLDLEKLHNELEAFVKYEK